jgi:hypothetical protein
MAMQQAIVRLGMTAGAWVRLAESWQLSATKIKLKVKNASMKTDWVKFKPWFSGLNAWKLPRFASGVNLHGHETPQLHLCCILQLMICWKFHDGRIH